MNHLHFLNLFVPFAGPSKHHTMPQKCVYFVGPGSTGKTTLAKALCETCTSPTFLLSEVARTVLSKLKYTAQDISNDAAKCYILQEAILVQQCQQERELLKLKRSYISDRSAIDPIVYAKFYIKDKNVDLLEKEEWHEMKSRYQNEKSSLIVFIEPNEAFLKDDGTRKMPTDLEEWKAFYRCFLEFMNDNHIPFKVIPRNMTNICDRSEQVKEWMEN